MNKIDVKGKEVLLTEVVPYSHLVITKTQSREFMVDVNPKDE